jgi:hypothetical protein
MAEFSRRALLHLAGTRLTTAALLPASSALADSHAEQSTRQRPYAAPVTFIAHRLGTDHAEGLAVIDMNADGHPDITSGAYWYENPRPAGGEWKRHKFRELAPIFPSTPSTSRASEKPFWGEFVADNGEFAIDVNHDGNLDLVTSSWQNDGVWWFENPGKEGSIWKPHLICHSKDTEGMVEADVDGDGKPDIIAAHYGRQGLFWISFAGPEPAVHYVGGRDQDGHGCGVTDVDGDRRPDILSVHGWFRQIDAARDRWEWLPEWLLGDCGFPILGYDVNDDGKMDVIYGHGHDYGIYWLEQTIQGGRRAWKRHLIDDSFSQVHALKLANLDGDGQPNCWLENATGATMAMTPDRTNHSPSTTTR